jgi:hypothetical protein
MSVTNDQSVYSTQLWPIPAILFIAWPGVYNEQNYKE